jgi:hypothetical protein
MDSPIWGMTTSVGIAIGSPGSLGYCATLDYTRIVRTSAQGVRLAN